MNISLLILTWKLLTSLSMMPAKDTTQPLNWEVAAGTENKIHDSKKMELLQANFWAWTERENGVQYNGAEGLISWKRSLFENSYKGVYREAQDIERLEVKTGLHFNGFGAGFGSVWDHSDPTIIGYARYKNKFIETGVNLSVDGVESYKAKVKYPLKNVTPMFEYRYYHNRRAFIQGKVVVGFSGVKNGSNK